MYQQRKRMRELPTRSEMMANRMEFKRRLKSIST